MIIYGYLWLIMVIESLETETRPPQIVPFRAMSPARTFRIVNGFPGATFVFCRVYADHLTSPIFAFWPLLTIAQNTSSNSSGYIMQKTKSYRPRMVRWWSFYNCWLVRVQGIQQDLTKRCVASVSWQMLGGGAVGIKGDNPRKLEYNPHSYTYGCISTYNWCTLK